MPARVQYMSYLLRVELSDLAQYAGSEVVFRKLLVDRGTLVNEPHLIPSITALNAARRNGHTSNYLSLAQNSFMDEV